MQAEQRRRELGDILKLRRESLRPEEFGLRHVGVRRTRGLRREEVAMLAGLSVSWYTWLEQGRNIKPSAETMGRIAQVLRLSDGEWCYVSLLAGLGLVNQKHMATHAATLSIESMQKTIDAFSATPALVYNGRFDVLCGNAVARAFYGGDIASGDRWERNMVWRFFMDPDRRRMYPDDQRDRGIRNLIGALRMNWAADESDGSVHELVDDLRRISSDFDAIWRGREVARLATVRGQVRPLGGTTALDVQYTRFCIPDSTGNVLAVLIPGNPESAAALERHIDLAG